MEERFHYSNNKVEVINARPQIAKVPRSLQQFFPRNTNTNGYNLTKSAWNYLNAEVYEAIWKWY
jgi:hypothetical protein